MAITWKTQVFLSKFNRLGNPNMRQIFSLRANISKKAVSSVYVKGPQQTLMKQKTGFWYVKLSLFVLNSYHRTVGPILLSPFLFHFTLTTGQGGQDDLFLFNPLSLLSCLFLRTVGP